MKSEFDTLEQYQESMKEFNENTRMGFEEFIQSHGSDRNKLQLRCTPYTSKKGGYGSFDLDFGLCVYQHQQSKVDELNQELHLVLNNWNDLTNAIHARTNGTAVAEARQLYEKVDELQKRVGDALKQSQSALRYVEEDMRGNHEFLKMAMVRTFKDLEQALKGGCDEAN